MRQNRLPFFVVATAVILVTFQNCSKNSGNDSSTSPAATTATDCFDITTCSSTSPFATPTPTPAVTPTPNPIAGSTPTPAPTTISTVLSGFVNADVPMSTDAPAFITQYFPLVANSKSFNKPEAGLLVVRSVTIGPVYNESMSSDGSCIPSATNEFSGAHIDMKDPTKDSGLATIVALGNSIRTVLQNGSFTLEPTSADASAAYGCQSYMQLNLKGQVGSPGTKTYLVVAVSGTGSSLDLINNGASFYDYSFGAAADGSALTLRNIFAGSASTSTTSRAAVRH